MYKTINERIREVLRENNISPTSYGTNLKEMSLSKFSRQLSGENAMTTDVIIAILRDFPDVSGEWLLCGKGNMYKTTESKDKTDIENEQNYTEFLKDKIKWLQEKNALLQKLVDEKDKRIAYYEALLHEAHEDYIEEKRKSV